MLLLCLVLVGLIVLVSNARAKRRVRLQWEKQMYARLRQPIEAPPKPCQRVGGCNIDLITNECLTCDRPVG